VAEHLQVDQPRSQQRERDQHEAGSRQQPAAEAVDLTLDVAQNRHAHTRSPASPGRWGRGEERRSRYS
jgi:hypothetical protein